MFPLFIHCIPLCTIAETLCTSKYFLTFQTIGSDPRLRYIQVMITRLLLSLKKAAASQEDVWSFREPSEHTTMRFAECQGGVSRKDEIHLDIFVSTRESTRSQE